MEKLIKDLEDHIVDCSGEDQDEASWEYEIGVLLTANEARQVVAVLKAYEPPVEADAKMPAIIAWLEQNQPDVFRRGIWDAIRTA